MGTYDSSRTRVAPVFDALMDREPSGQTWSLLELGSRSVGRLPNSTKPALIPNHPRWWGNNERRLDPPQSLLRWLIANASAPASEGFWGGVGTRAKRERLVARDPEVIAEALRLLKSSSTFRKWYVLEGRSQPDALLETTVADSLPHRDPGTTWQRVCAEFELGWPPYEDSVGHEPPVDVIS